MTSSLLELLIAAKNTADNNSMIIIDSNGIFNTDDTDLEETAYYEGSKNPIIFSRSYNQEFICNFKLHKYPFDVQTCQILLSPTPKDKFFIKLIPTNVTYSGPIEMLTYTVKSYQICSCYY